MDEAMQTDALFDHEAHPDDGVEGVEQVDECELRDGRNEIIPKAPPDDRGRIERAQGMGREILEQAPEQRPDPTRDATRGGAEHCELGHEERVAAGARPDVPSNFVRGRYAE